MIIRQILLMSFIFGTNLIAQTEYQWPCTPFDQQHFINGGFCENRPDGAISIDHFHDGIDIHLLQGNNVYSVISGTVTSLSRVGINAYVRVGRYAYVHVDPSPNIQVGSIVVAYQTVLGTTNSWNHIHFKDGYSGSEINALRADGGLIPMVDNYKPAVDGIEYYINGTLTRFANNRVSGRVEIVAKARDRTDNGVLGDNNGIHEIGFQIYDATGNQALTDSIINFNFYQIPASHSYVTNVFFPGSDISNYYYTITNRVNGDGFWDTRSYAPGTYKVKVFTSDPELNSSEFWSTVEVVAQDIYPPARPDWLFLETNSSNNLRLSWLANDSTDIAGYDLYFSFNGVSWSKQISISANIQPLDTTLIIYDYPKDAAVFFRLVAYDNSAVPNFSDSSDVYGARLSISGPDLLIVDAFDRTDGYWNRGSHSYNLDYGLILDELDLAFNSCSEDMILRGDIRMSDYETVIYMLGDEGSGEPALSTDEQDLLKEYLRQGGNLIISGSELATGLSSAPDSAGRYFLSEFLRAELVSDSSVSLQVKGKASTSFDGFSTAVNAPNGKTIACDVITPAGSEPIILYDDNGVSGVYASGVFSGGSAPARLVYLAFPIELISDRQARRFLLSRIFDLFDVQTDIAVSDQSKQLSGLMLTDNYPNPFNPATQIRFNLEAPENVILEILSIDGQKIKTLINRTLSAGRHQVAWDGTDINGGNVSSGIYIYRLRTPGHQIARKMTLLR